MTGSSPRRTVAMATATAMLAVLSPMLPAQAQYIYGDGSQQAMRREARLTPEQQQEIFRARKSWRKQSFNRRKSMMEKERRCINDSRDLAGFQACRNQFKQARRTLRSDYRAYINPVRRRVGLPPLEDKRRGDGQARGKGKGKGRRS